MRPRALVTGAGIRVGRGIALELAPTFDLAIHYRSSEEPAEEVAERCREQGSDAWTVQGDLGTLDGIETVVRGVHERWDKLHLLVNNASIYGPKAFDEITLEDWDAMQDVNLRAPFLLSQGLLGLLEAEDDDFGEHGAHGVVVHMCDIGADRPRPRYAHYSVSKAGLVMLVKAMAVELAPAIRTVGISPGQVAWPEDYSDEKRARIASRIPMGEAGTPEDVGKLVRFLATEAGYLNGNVIAIDGGLSVRYWLEDPWTGSSSTTAK